ncbi:MAG: M28 family peptidase [Actinomycetes bacterium]
MTLPADRAEGPGGPASEPPPPSTPHPREALAPGEAAGRRLDEVVAELAGTSRAQAARWAEQGLVEVDGRPRPKAHRLRGGERLAWTPPPAPPAGEPVAEDRPLAVRYEDDRLLVVAKPAGLVVHPGPGHPTGTLVNALLGRAQTPLSAGGGAADRPGIVHRLDKDTSGLLLVAKDDATHLALARALAGHPAALDLRMILFGGEEEGLFGSRQYVAALPAAERVRIRTVLNLDMVGSLNTAAPAVLLEGAPRSAAMINDLATAAATVTTLAVETSLHPFASDHVPFLDAGIPAVLTIEGADSANGNIHSDRDVLATVNPSLAMQILRMDVAALVGWLEPVAQVPRPAGSAVSWGPGRLDVFGIGTGTVPS